MLIFDFQKQNRLNSLPSSIEKLINVNWDRCVCVEHKGLGITYR